MLNRPTRGASTLVGDIDFQITRRKASRWQLLGGYTFSTTRVDATNIGTPNSTYVNGFGLRVNSGLPVTRTWADPELLDDGRDQLRIPLQRRHARELSFDLYNAMNANMIRYIPAGECCW